MLYMSTKKLEERLQFYRDSIIKTERIMTELKRQRKELENFIRQNRIDSKFLMEKWSELTNEISAYEKRREIQESLRENRRDFIRLICKSRALKDLQNRMRQSHASFVKEFYNTKMYYKTLKVKK